MDYEPTCGIRYPDQIDLLTVPLDIRKRLKEVIIKNLNNEIEKDKPKIQNMVLILLTGILFVFSLYSTFLKKPYNLILALFSFVVMILNFFYIVASFPLKESLIPKFLKEIEVQTQRVAVIKLRYEYRAKYRPTDFERKLDQYEVLTGFIISIDQQRLKEYLKEKASSDEEIKAIELKSFTLNDIEAQLE